MRPCGALESCCPLKNADSGQATPRHQPCVLVSKSGTGQAVIPAARRWETENHKLGAHLGSGTRCRLRKRRAQDSTSSITESRTWFPRMLSAQFPVSRSSWEAKGNPPPDNLVMAAHSQCLSWLLVRPFLNTTLGAFILEVGNRTPDTLPWLRPGCSHVHWIPGATSPSPTHRSSAFSHYIFSGWY